MIEFRKVGFTYDGQNYVLDHVGLSIPQGTFACILGGNGSGKSTLAKHVNALLIPDQGKVNVLDRDTSDAANLYFIRSNAGLVFQNPDDQIVASLVENDVAFGPENLGVPAAQLRQRVTEALEKVGLQGFEERETASLSGGQKQRVAIAGVLAMQPQILVLDEASAMLDPRGRKGLLRVCCELNQQGLTILMITHFMEEAALADVVYILEDGRIVAQGSPDEVLSNVASLETRCLDVPFAAKMSHLLQQRGLDVGVHVGEETLANALSDKLGLKTNTQQTPNTQVNAPIVLDTEPSGAALVAFENVSYTYDPTPNTRRLRSGNKRQADWGNSPEQLWALRDVSFTLHEGEFLGVAGHTGSGKSTLLQHMNGLLHPTTGCVRVQGADIASKAAAAKAREQVGLVFQYPEHQLFAATVYDDVAFGPRNMGLPEDEVRTRVVQALEMVGLSEAELGRTSPFELSGGQQRRVAFAGVLAMRPRTLILDEPAAGLDPKARAEFLHLIEEFHRNQGMAIVMASHSMDDLARLCNRILVLNQGKQFALGTPEQVFSDEARMLDVGLGVPGAQHLANVLRTRGLPLPETGLFTAEALADAVAGTGNKQ